MTTEQPYRRFGDKSFTNLEDMIAAENDASRRALLLILATLNTNLQNNTVMTQEVNVKLTSHLDRFGNHIEKYNEYVNKGKGIWVILMWVFVVAQSALAYSTLKVTEELRSHAEAIYLLKQGQIRLNTLTDMHLKERK